MTSFARALGERGGNPSGREGEAIRGPWQEIVGVVPNFPAHVDCERLVTVALSVLILAAASQ